MLNVNVDVNIDVKGYHYPFHFERKNICVSCGAEKALKFINIFGKESGSEIHPFESIKCSECGAPYSILWERGEDDKMYPSAVDPTIKKDFISSFRETFQKNKLVKNL